MSTDVTPETETTSQQAEPLDRSADRLKLMRLLCNDLFFPQSKPSPPAIAEPITVDEAKNFAMSLLGTMGERDVGRMRQACWHHLIASSTPEQRLSCERMINALGMAIGMTRHEQAARIIAENRAARDAKREADWKQYQLDRWRNFPAGASGQTS